MTSEYTRTRWFCRSFVGCATRVFTYLFQHLRKSLSVIVSVRKSVASRHACKQGRSENDQQKISPDIRRTSPPQRAYRQDPAGHPPPQEVRARRADSDAGSEG